jgi:hypothetical protein
MSFGAIWPVQLMNCRCITQSQSFVGFSNARDVRNYIVSVITVHIILIYLFICLFSFSNFFLSFFLCLLRLTVFLIYDIFYFLILLIF